MRKQLLSCAAALVSLFMPTMSQASSSLTPRGNNADGFSSDATTSTTTKSNGEFASSSSTSTSFKLVGVQYSPLQSLVSFSATDPTTTTQEHEDAYGYLRQGSVSAFDGSTLYVFSPRTNNYGELYKLSYSTYTYDGSAWALNSTKELTADYSNYPNAMAYDPATGNLYGYRNGMPSTFYSIDKETGAMSQVSTANYFFTSLAFDMNGTGYAFDFDSQLQRVNVQDGSVTVLGATGQSFSDKQPTYIDATTGTMYWVLSTSKVSALYTTDLTTGAGTKVGDLPEGTKLSDIFGIGSSTSQDAQVPDACQNLTVTYATAGSTTATFKATAPTLSFDKATPLSSKVNLLFYVDDAADAVATLSDVAPGTEVSTNYTFPTEGEHKVKVLAANGNGNGPTKTVTTYAGYDAPKAPSDVYLSVAADGTYHLSWTAPTEGVHGGAVDAASFKYTVTQYPAGEKVTETTGTSYEGQFTSTQFADYYFGVKATSGAKEGEEGLSNHVTHGNYAEIPYYDDFSNSDTYGTYTIVNTNNDATWEFGTANTGDQAAIYNGSSCTSAADDYLILPPMQIVKGATYTVTFNVASAFNQDTGNTIDVLLLKDNANPQGTRDKVGTYENIPDYTAGISEQTFTYTAKESGVFNFAFYCRSQAKHKVNLFDVYINGTNFPDAPNDVTNYKVAAADKGEHKVTVTFNAPTKDSQGHDLSSLSHIRLFRDNSKTALYEWSNPTPGAAYSYTDETVAEGLHSYKAVVTSDNGSSNGASQTVLVGQDVPGAPSNLKVTQDGDDFVLTWTAPSTSVNGLYVDYDNLTYAIYYEYGLMETPSLYTSDVKGCTARVPKSVFDAYASAHQILIDFMVLAQSENGAGSPAYATTIYGKNYTVPFTESFENGYNDTDPWSVTSVSDNYASCWTMIAGTNSKKPMDVDAADGDNGMAMFYQNSSDGYEARLLSPQISVADADAPVLSFYLYHYKANAAMDNSVQVELQYAGSDNFVALSEPISVYGEAGWQEHKFSLANVENDCFRLSFRGKAAKLSPIFMDKVQILDDKGYNALKGVNGATNGVSVANGGIVIEGQGAPYSVFTTTGALVAQGKAEGKQAIRLHAGLYLVKVNGTTTKCVVK